MTVGIKKRTYIRIISFLVAAIVIASSFAYISMQQGKTQAMSLKHQSMSDIEDLITHTQNINNDLKKAMYAKSPAMLSQISSKVWREAGLAKDIISDMPIDYIKLQNTNKLLSQVGDYCVSLAKSFANGATITEEQRKNLVELQKYCESMTNEAVVVSDQIRTGSISFNKAGEQFGGTDVAQGSIGESFSDFEEGFTAYPTLIYDGPFSDHIMQREPLRLKNEGEVTKQAAKEKAARATAIAVAALKDGDDEKSKMESYCFTGDGVDVSVTKKGGLIATMMKSRMVDGEKISVEDALSHGEKYLSSLGVSSVVVTYYEIANNVMTINYAYKQDEVTMYTDLIKVGVAMDNGEIVSFDARGYIVNHVLRKVERPTFTQKEAQEAVSGFLTVQSGKLCIVPSGGLSEVLCYEFKCKAEDGTPLLVYINANSKAEERILILLINENGTLTM